MGFDLNSIAGGFGSLVAQNPNDITLSSALSAAEGAYGVPTPLLPYSAVPVATTPSTGPKANVAPEDQGRSAGPNWTRLGIIGGAVVAAITLVVLLFRRKG